VTTDVDLIKWRKAIRHPDGPTSPTMRHVLLTLSTWGNSEGCSMFPSIETLAVATRLHRDTVGRTLQKAVADGWLTRKARGNLADEIKAARMFGYAYAAAVPGCWKYLDELDHRWERDPTWVSERKHRPRGKTGHVPVHGRDTPPAEGSIKPSANGSTVPALDHDVPTQGRECPGPGSEPSPSDAVSVPVQGRMKSSSNSSMNKSMNGSSEGALTRTARETANPKANSPDEDRARRIDVAVRLCPKADDHSLRTMVHGATLEEVRAARRRGVHL
jgi:hypothetical protein